MVEGARLESVYRGNSIEGSNPSLSARMKSIACKAVPVSQDFAGFPALRRGSGILTAGLPEISGTVYDL